MSRRKFIAVRRGAAAVRALRLVPAAWAPTAAQLPEALNTASGVVSTSRLSRHSRSTSSSLPLPLRLTASTSRRPSRLPRSSKSSATMSSAGSEVATGSSSSDSTSAVASRGTTSRASRACSRAPPLAPGWRYST